MGSLAVLSEFGSDREQFVETEPPASILGYTSLSDYEHENCLREDLENLQAGIKSTNHAPGTTASENCFSA